MLSALTSKLHPNHPVPSELNRALVKYKGLIDTSVVCQVFLRNFPNTVPLPHIEGEEVVNFFSLILSDQQHRLGNPDFFLELARHSSLLVDPFSGIFRGIQCHDPLPFSGRTTEMLSPLLDRAVFLIAILHPTAEIFDFIFRSASFSPRKNIQPGFVPDGRF